MKRVLNLQEMSLTELKALAYDIFMKLNAYDAKLVEVNKIIDKKRSEKPAEVNDETKEEEK